MESTQGKVTFQDIKKIILAGGSSSCLDLKESIINYLYKNEAKNFSIYSQDLFTSVAKGTALYQLYKNHEKKEWSGAIRTTLPWKLKLVHNINPKGEEERIVLGEQGQLLPIKKDSFFRSNTRTKSAKMPISVKPYYRLEVDNKYGNPYSANIDIEENLPLYNLFGYLRFIHIQYYIDRFSIVKYLKLVPKDIFPIFPFKKKDVHIKRNITQIQMKSHNDQIEALNKFSEGSELIQLKNDFIPE